MRVVLVYAVSLGALFVYIDAVVYKKEWLVEAASNGNECTVDILLRRGVDVNAQCHDSTALMEASVMGHERVVRLLLQHGADVHRGDSWGEPALTKAVHMGYVDIVWLLLQYGADVNASCYSIGRSARTTPLKEAIKEAARWEFSSCRPDYLEIISLLLWCKSCIEPIDWPELINVSVSCFEILQEVLEYGIAINAARTYGGKALLKAVEVCNIEAVRLLLQYGVSADTVENGRTALVRALEVQGWFMTKQAAKKFKQKRKKIVDLLVVEGATVPPHISWRLRSQLVAVRREKYNTLHEVLQKRGGLSNDTTDVILRFVSKRTRAEYRQEKERAQQKVGCIIM